MENSIKQIKSILNKAITQNKNNNDKKKLFSNIKEDLYLEKKYLMGKEFYVNRNYDINEYISDDIEIENRLGSGSKRDCYKIKNNNNIVIKKGNRKNSGVHNLKEFLFFLLIYRTNIKQYYNPTIAISHDLNILIVPYIKIVCNRINNSLFVTNMDKGINFLNGILFDKKLMKEYYQIHTTLNVGGYADFGISNDKIISIDYDGLSIKNDFFDNLYNLHINLS
jgi:hypothetical protein